jgi:hypothetical protein
MVADDTGCATRAQEEKMSAHSSNITTDHDEIRRWVEARGGKPSTVKRTEKDGEPGVLRIDFPGYSGEGSLEEISWDDFFKKFEESKLAFVYQELTASGQQSNFCKLVRRTEELDEEPKTMDRSRSPSTKVA